MGECVEDMRALEGNLANTYIKARVERLNEVLSEYFEEDGMEWKSAPLPVGVRECTFEIINSLVGIAQLYTSYSHACLNNKAQNVAGLFRLKSSRENSKMGVVQSSGFGS